MWEWEGWVGQEKEKEAEGLAASGTSVCESMDMLICISGKDVGGKRW